MFTLPLLLLRGMSRLPEMFVRKFTISLLHLFSIFHLVWVVAWIRTLFCHPSTWVSQISYWGLCTCSMAIFSLVQAFSSFGVFAWEAVHAQQRCSRGEHCAVIPRALPTQPSAVIKVPMKTGVYSLCNISTCKTKRVWGVKLSCLHMTLGALMKPAIGLFIHKLPVQPLLFA